MLNRQGDTMQFRVERTSVWDDAKEGGKPPCEGAVLGEYLHRDERGWKSIDDANEHVKKDWYSRGEDHGHADNGNIVRYLRWPCWLIEIDGMNGLLAFAKEHGELVLDAYSGNIPCIEIYDSYRE